MEAALLLVVQRGIALPEALELLDSGLMARVEQELSRAELPSVLTVRASPELAARLPVGMCRRLLAVPVHVDPRSGRVDIAAVEPLDPHVLQEFAYHLDQPIRVLQASYEAVSGALERLQQSAKVSVLPSVPGKPRSDAPIPLVKVDPSGRSDAPIPLVRRSLPPVRSPSALPRRPSQVPRALPEAEGVKASWRSRPPPTDLLSEATALERSAATKQAAERVSAQEQLEQAQTPDAVLAVLRDCMNPAASIVFAVKSTSFDGRVASPNVDQRRAIKELSLFSHQPSVLETAVKSGFYLGPVPNTPNHRELRDALPPDAAEEVYVTVVTVSDRPSLVWLVAGFEQSLDLTRRTDEIALLAGRALSRILRQRKKGA